MKNITIIDREDETITFSVEDNTTINALIHQPDFLAMFGETDAGAFEDEDYAFNGTQVPSALRAGFGASEIPDGATLAFDREFDPDYVAEHNGDEDEEDDDADVTATGTPGMITVSTSGGIRTFSLPIINGATSVDEVLGGERFADLSGMTPQIVSAQTVLLNDEEVQPGVFAAKKLHNGDVLSLIPRAAHTKA